ncbi:MAG: hypothetical protein ABIQ74_11465 [Chitinophagales bacterium]
MMITLLTSCKKDSANNDVTAVTDHAIAEGESNRVIQAVNSAAYHYDVRDIQDDSILPSCANITIDTISLFKSITIDFDTVPCLCSDWDGKYRQGIISATWTGLYRDSGTVITITTMDYYQGMLPSEMNKFDYNKTVTSMGHNANGNLHYSINVIEALVTIYSGQTISWTSQRDREWTLGDSTLLPFDDVYSITGSASGTDRNANPFSVIITSPLIAAFTCPWIKEGTLDITHGNLPVAILDYGGGSCDASATVTINGILIPVIL